MPIGAAEYKPKEDVIEVAAEGGGAPPQNQCVVQCSPIGLLEFRLQNKGNENVTYQLFARGRLTTVAGENIAALQVGVTDQFQGLLANRRIAPGSFSATDAGGATQTVTDGGVADADGNGTILDAALNVVGTINYESGAIDFTWAAAFVGAGVTASYTHRGWIAFGAPIGGTVVAGGGAVPVVCLPTGGSNWVAGITGQTLVGIQMWSAGVGSSVVVTAKHVGDDSQFKLVPTARFRNLNSPLTEV